MTAADAPVIDSKTRTVGLLLDPLDVLYCGDGRPFGGAVRGQSLPTPLPQTMAGAVWTALLDAAGCDFAGLVHDVSEKGLPFEKALAEQGLSEDLADVHVRGPWLARFPAAVSEGVSPAPEVFVAAPAILHKPKHARDRQTLHRLSPLPDGTPLPGWARTPSGRRYDQPRPLWLHSGEATEPAAGLIALPALQRFLSGEPLDAADLLEQHALIAFDHRTGIAIDAVTFTAAETYIYTTSFVAFARRDGFQAGLYAELAVPDSVAPLLDRITTLRLGGESRRVAVRPCEPVEWPDVAPGPNDRSLLVLTTAGLFADAWRPRLPNGLNVVAAAVPGSIPVSGWDLARGGPKPARFAVPPGSVYFLDGPATGLPAVLADDDLLRRQGWGCFVRGVWRG